MVEETEVTSNCTSLALCYYKPQPQLQELHVTGIMLLQTSATTPTTARHWHYVITNLSHNSNNCTSLALCYYKPQPQLQQLHVTGIMLLQTSATTPTTARHWHYVITNLSHNSNNCTSLALCYYKPQPQLQQLHVTGIMLLQTSATTPTTARHWHNVITNLSHNSNNC